MESLKTTITGIFGAGAIQGTDVLMPASGDVAESGVKIGMQILIGIVTLVQLIRERRQARRAKRRL